MNEARGAKWEKEAGDKRAPFPLLERSNVTFGGHERDDETEEPKETWRNLGQRGKAGGINAYLFVKYLSHLRYPGPPLDPPEPVCPCTCSSHPMLSPLKLPCMQILFKNHCQGSQSDTQNMENGTAMWSLGGGPNLNLRSHRLWTWSKAKIEEKFLQKRNQGSWYGRISSFSQHGITCTCAHWCQQKHKHTASGLWVGGIW